MKLQESKQFFDRGVEVMTKMYDHLAAKPPLQLSDLNPAATALVVIDMLNGFTKAGALQSDLIKEIIPDIQTLMKKCQAQDIPMVLFADSHTTESPEFKSYPPHCMQDTEECEVVEELQLVGGYQLIKKNSTNGFLEPEFQKWLHANPQIDTFIIAGDCTDICIEQFANTLKAYFNMKNQPSRIIVPLNAVETFELDLHQASLLNIMAIFIMLGNGIEVVSQVD